MFSCNSLNMGTYLMSNYQKSQLAAMGRVRVSCMGDGLCFPYSSYHAMRRERGLQLSFGEFLSKFYAALKAYCPTAADKIPYETEPIPISDLEEEAHRYVFHYVDSNAIVDFGPTVMASLFECNIQLIQPGDVFIAAPFDGIQATVSPFVLCLVSPVLFGFNVV